MTYKPIIFLHFHKAAGTTLVQNAIDSGYQLPYCHNNGSIYLDDMPVYFCGNRSLFVEQMNLYFSLPNQFISFEWDFPYDFIQEYRDRFYLTTILRDPIDRIISNYNFDINYGYTDKEDIISYLNNEYFYCSDNYYIRKILNLRSDEIVTDFHLSASIKILEGFDVVSLLESKDCWLKFESYGFNGCPIPKNMSSNFNNIELDKDFLNSNFFNYDVLLYNHFKSIG
jgi:hypothetical protein